MTDNVENTASPASPPPSAPGKKGRGRPPNKATSTETPRQRIERLRAELQKAEAAQQAAEQHQDAIVGKVVRRHALAHADYRRQLATLLRAEVKSKADLAAIAELLA